MDQYYSHLTKTQRHAETGSELLARKTMQSVQRLSGSDVVDLSKLKFSFEKISFIPDASPGSHRPFYNIPTRQASVSSVSSKSDYAEIVSTSPLEEGKTSTIVAEEEKRLEPSKKAEAGCEGEKAK